MTNTTRAISKRSIMHDHKHSHYHRNHRHHYLLLLLLKPPCNPVRVLPPSSFHSPLHCRPPHEHHPAGHRIGQGVHRLSHWQSSEAGRGGVQCPARPCKTVGRRRWTTANSPADDHPRHSRWRRKPSRPRSSRRKCLAEKSKVICLLTASTTKRCV